MCSEKQRRHNVQHICGHDEMKWDLYDTHVQLITPFSLLMVFLSTLGISVLGSMVWSWE